MIKQETVAKFKEVEGWLKCTWTQIIFISFQIQVSASEGSHVNLAELAVIWTNDRDMRGMGLFSILRHKWLCNAKFV